MFALLLVDDMDPFYQNIASFPTVIFTFVLAVLALYWLVAVLGIVDIKLLHIDLTQADGTFDSGMDSGQSGPNALAGLMLRYGLVGVPVTVILSFVALFGWLISYYTVHLIFPFVPDGVLRYLVGIPILSVSLYCAVLCTAVVIKPLRRFFQQTDQQTIKRVLGQVAIVRTKHVNAGFGEAMLNDGGAGLILKVRATGGQVFARGDRVVLLDYSAEENAYRVVSEQEFEGTSLN
ncbi:MAG: DUF1449 domain-containing protein [unclassified Hahellaceae]|nr:DUF1449 domain-containing protein [Hahellaceae bacterium]|tara:strand:+ start:11286 stop:11987 length:702 start_codon:yes stop_codon:yes gene_type:complete